MHKLGRCQQSLMSDIWEGCIHGELIEKSLQFNLLSGILQTFSWWRGQIDTLTALNWVHLLCTRITELSDISRGGEMAEQMTRAKTSVIT